MQPRQGRVIADEYEFGDLVSVSEPGHADGCRARPVFKVERAEPLVYLAICVAGCPHRERAIQRGKALAEEHGW